MEVEPRGTGFVREYSGSTLVTSVVNLTLVRPNITVSFIEQSTVLKGLLPSEVAALGQPVFGQNISKYLNITSGSSDNYSFINISEFFPTIKYYW